MGQHQCKIDILEDERWKYRGYVISICPKKTSLLLQPGEHDCTIIDRIPIKKPSRIQLLYAVKAMACRVDENIRKGVLKG